MYEEGPLLSHYKQAKVLSYHVLPLGTQIKPFFFPFRCIYSEFHCQKTWLDKAFLNPTTDNLSGSCYNYSSPNSECLLVAADGEWEKLAPRLVREDSGEPDISQKESSPDCQTQRDIIIH